ncbi:hypothetical protein [Hyphomicrobium sp. DY-1]|uniref:hypothetical protein n=1 Tax=Hyphomicrobium sp. DY-1 TaxID=3075650 RepID=UPI0039C18B66
MKISLALDASTALNWAESKDRALIHENLLTNSEVLAGEIINARSPEERMWFMNDLAWVYRRLAVCDMLAARDVERRMDDEENRSKYVSFTLEKMADMLEEANMSPAAGMDRHYLVIAKAFAMRLGEEKVDGWFTDGPWGGLGRLSGTVAAMDIDTALRERHAFPELIKMARMIPPGQGVDEEKIESQIFRDGLRLFRRHQGLEKYPHEK